MRERDSDEGASPGEALSKDDSDLIVLCDADNTVRYNSPSVRRILDYKPDELLGVSISSVVHPDDLGSVIGEGERTAQESVRRASPVRYRHKDGSWVYLESTTNNLLDVPGIRGTVVTAREMTVRRRAEEKSYSYDDLERQVELRTAQLDAALADADDSTELLRLSEERFRTLVRHASDTIMVLDTEGKILYESPAVERVLGFKLEQRIGTNAFDYLHPEDVETVRNRFSEVLEKPDERLSVEYRVLDKDGSWRYVEAIGTNVLDNPVIGGIIINARDITTRRRAEEELRQSEERFRLLVEGVEDHAIFMLDPDGRVTTWNEGAQRTMGYTTPEIIGEHFSVFYTEEDVERGHPEEELAVAIREGCYEEEGLRVRKDGSRFWADVVITALRDEKGNLRGLSKVTRDITVRREAEDALRRSLKELADLKFALDESAIVAITDQRGQITYVNDKLCEISKFPRDELLGQEHRILNSDYHPKKFIDELWRTIERGEVWRGEISDRAKDGSIYWVNTTVVPLLDERGKPYRYVAVCSDVTGRKEAEDALRRSLKELADLKFALDESAIVAITDVTGTITYVNDKFCEISGYSRDDLLGQDHRIINPDYHPKEFIEQLWRTIERGEIWRGETKNRAKDGSIYWADTTIVPFLNERGKPYRYVAIRYDITDRREAEEALRASEERFRSLIRYASDIIVVLDADGKILYESPAAERILGLRPQQRVGTSFFDRVDPDDVGWVRKKLTRLLEAPRERTSMWYRIRDEKGSWRHFEGIATNLLHDPAVGGIVVNIRDITERRQAEQALREREELYRSVVDQAAETIFLIDLETKRVLESNAALHRSLGYTAQELKRMTLYDIVAHDRESTDDNIGRVLENGRYYIGKRKYRRKDGELVDMMVSASALSYGDREAHGGREALCVVARDMTDNPG